MKIAILVPAYFAGDKATRKVCWNRPAGIGGGLGVESGTLIQNQKMRELVESESEVSL